LEGVKLVRRQTYGNGLPKILITFFLVITASYLVTSEPSNGTNKTYNITSVTSSKMFPGDENTAIGGGMPHCPLKYAHILT